MLVAGETRRRTSRREWVWILALAGILLLPVLLAAFLLFIRREPLLVGSTWMAGCARPAEEQFYTEDAPPGYCYVRRYSFGGAIYPEDESWTLRCGGYTYYLVHNLNPKHHILITGHFIR